jgi:uncharacterized protein DUF6894
MPMYHFHVHVVDGTTQEDEVGEDLPSVEAAIEYGRKFGAGLMEEASKFGKPVQQVIEIVDAEGYVVAQVECANAIGSRSSIGTRTGD